MKKYRRIEITAFHRRLTIVSGEATANNVEGQTDPGVRLSDADALETIEPESAEGQRILTEAVRLLEENLEQSSQDCSKRR